MNVKFAVIDEVYNINLTGEVLSEDDYAKLAPSVPVKASQTNSKKAKTVKKSTK
jgi:hypothetical protein